MKWFDRWNNIILYIPNTNNSYIKYNSIQLVSINKLLIVDMKYYMNAKTYDLNIYTIDIEVGPLPLHYLWIYFIMELYN